MSARSQSIVSWVIIGLIAGFLASVIVPSSGNLFGWLIAGLLGSVVGGFLAQQLKISLNFGNPFLEQVVISFGGAIIVLIVARLIILG
ncbi:MAG: GlsB/YeaQ/YmgE family stress response membrane protein [Bauldia sp.]